MRSQGTVWLACCLLAACSQPRVTRLRIGMNPWPGYAHLAVAVQAGLFAEQGIDAQLVEYTSLHDLSRGFADGQIDVLPSTLVEVLTLHAERRRLPEVVWLADHSTGGDVVVARAENAAALRGRRIGFEPHSLGSYVLARFLERHQLSPTDVEAVSMSQDQLATAFAEGRIDAAITYPPFSTQMLAIDGARCVFDTREIPDEVIDTISIDRDLLDRDPTLVGRFHTAMAAAHRLSAVDPASTERMMARGCGMSTDEFRSAKAGIEVYGPEVQADWLRGGSRLRLLAERIGRELKVPANTSDFVLAANRSSPLLAPAAPR
jgi:NitT/TauT family transport system substrate-binding protein